MVTVTRGPSPAMAANGTASEAISISSYRRKGKRGFLWLLLFFPMFLLLLFLSLLLWFVPLLLSLSRLQHYYIHIRFRDVDETSTEFLSEWNAHSSSSHTRATDPQVLDDASAATRQCKEHQSSQTQRENQQKQKEVPLLQHLQPLKKKIKWGEREKTKRV